MNSGAVQELFETPSREEEDEEDYGSTMLYRVKEEKNGGHFVACVQPTSVIIALFNICGALLTEDDNGTRRKE